MQANRFKWRDIGQRRCGIQFGQPLRCLIDIKPAEFGLACFRELPRGGVGERLDHMRNIIRIGYNVKRMSDADGDR